MKTPSLPGGDKASDSIPLSVVNAHEKGASLMADGGLSVPLAYKTDTLGVLVLWNEPSSGSSTAAQDEAQQQEEQHDERKMPMRSVGKWSAWH